jgi:hypothetical protein
MRQRGRIGALQRETNMLFGRQTMAHVHRLLPVPDDLKEPEAEIWRVVVRQSNFNAAAAALLHNGLRMHAIARTAQETVAAQGVMITDRNGHQRMHPMLRIERSSRQLFYQIFKLLHIQTEFDDDG